MSHSRLILKREGWIGLRTSSIADGPPRWLPKILPCWIKMTSLHQADGPPSRLIFFFFFFFFLKKEEKEW